jgi:predicted naringenin-chalcone synthase
MQLISIASHFPEFSYSQSDCLSALKDSQFWSKLSSRSHRILDKVFSLDTGINKRHLSTNDLSSIWNLSASQLNKYYESHAPKIGSQALQHALSKANVAASEIDVLLVSSCTGYLCPGLSSYLAEQIGCKEDIHNQDITGHGCGAAIPLLQIADAYIGKNPEMLVACVAVEISSAAFFISDDPDVLISTCLFGDGASASLWKSNGGNYETGRFNSLLLPKEREKVRFINEDGKLKNQLHKSVPKMTAAAAKRLFDKTDPKRKIITHGGGRDVIAELEKSLSCPSLEEARFVLANYGNLSSPSVLVALEKHLQSPEPSDQLWICTFGAGFSAHSLELNKKR